MVYWLALSKTESCSDESSFGGGDATSSFEDELVLRTFSTASSSSGGEGEESMIGAPLIRTTILAPVINCNMYQCYNLFQLTHKMYALLILQIPKECNFTYRYKTFHINLLSGLKLRYFNLSADVAFKISPYEFFSV